jgi:hypothetical protein
MDASERGTVPNPTHIMGETMDILVRVEESPDQSAALAYVSSSSSLMYASEEPRDVVTLYGAPSAESLALALAAAVESRRGEDHAHATRHLGLWAERGAIGDTAWRDNATGELITRDLDIPLEILQSTATQILSECGNLVRRLVAGLSMADWPEGVQRAIRFPFAPVMALAVPARGQVDAMLETVREADALAFDSEGD